MNIDDATMMVAVTFCYTIEGWVLGCVTGFLVHMAMAARKITPPPRRRVRLHRRRKTWAQPEPRTWARVELLPEPQTLELVK